MDFILRRFRQALTRKVSSTAFICLAIIGLCGVSFVVPAPSSPAAAADRFASRGSFANASFVSTDASGCIETEVSIAAAERPTADGRRADRPAAVAFATLLQRDACAGTRLIAASGFADLAAGQFLVDEGETATLDASIAVVDTVSALTFDLDAEVAWRSASDVERFGQHLLIEEPALPMNARLDCTGMPCTNRNARVSGSVSDGAVTFTPDPGIGAIGTATSGLVVVFSG